MSDNSEPKDKPLEVRFAPGCFDDFDGTPEELQDLIAQIHQMAADGTIFEHSKPVPADEAEEVMRRIAENLAKRQ